MDRYDSYEQTRKLHAENLWLRELVTTAAQELERLASRGQGDRETLLRRAQRLRRKLHQGPEERPRFYPRSRAPRPGTSS
jgi:hypothetical protein